MSAMKIKELQHKRVEHLHILNPTVRFTLKEHAVLDFLLLLLFILVLRDLPHLLSSMPGKEL